jgi:hypothetical protein
VCREARIEAGVTALAVVVQARAMGARNVSEPTLTRFEQGAGWRRDTDLIVAAYAHECGVELMTLWRRAVNG